MAAAVTYSKVLKIVDQLAAKDREKLFHEMKERRRKVWVAEIEAASEEAMKDHRAGKLRTLSSPEEIRAYCQEMYDSDEE